VIKVMGDDVVLPNGHFHRCWYRLLSATYSQAVFRAEEVDIVAAPASVVQVSPLVVEAPLCVAVAPSAAAHQTTTSTSWSSGTVEQKKTTRFVDSRLQKQTTTTWKNAYPYRTTRQTPLRQSLSPSVPKLIP
jgi:hypothetical protein